MPYQHIRPWRLRFLQQGVELSGNLKAGARLRTRITVSVARPIIRANPGEALDTRLDADPAQGRLAKARIQDHGWRANAGAVDVETITPDVHHLASNREPAS